MPPRPVLSLAARSAVLALAACSGPGGGAGFTFTLTPTFIDGQDVLAGEPDVELVVLRPGVEADVIHLGTASEGAALELPEVEPFEAGTVLGLLLESGGNPNEWSPGDTVGYGQVALDEAPGDATTVEVLVPAVGALGEVGQLASAKRRFCASAAMLPDGDVYLFGGKEPESVTAGQGSDKISVLRETDSGETDFVQIDATLPEADGTSARCAATATPVTVAGAPMILLAGGRPNWNSIGHLQTWHLFDPADETFVKKGEMSAAHSGHLAVPFASGEVLLFAGMSSEGWPQVPRYDVWQPTDVGGRIVDGGDDGLIQTGLLHVMGAPLGDDVVVCGGVNDVGDIDTFDWEPKAGCNRVRPNGSVQPFDALPVELAAGAMAPLPGGGLLVTGGYSDHLIDETNPPTASNTPATDAVWLYVEGEGWKGTGSSLGHARAHHRMIALADGRVLVVGGTTDGSALLGNLVEAVGCAEIYDPATGFFSDVDCAEISGGADPLVASSPAGEGAFVYQGFTRDGPIYDGQTRYGFVATGPPPLE